MHVVANERSFMGLNEPPAAGIKRYGQAGRAVERRGVAWRGGVRSREVSGQVDCTERSWNSTDSSHS